MLYLKLFGGVKLHFNYFLNLEKIVRLIYVLCNNYFKLKRRGDHLMAKAKKKKR